MNPSPDPIQETIVEQFWHLVDEPLRRLNLKEIVQAAYSAGMTAQKEKDAGLVENAPLFWVGGAVNRRDVAAAIRKGDGE
ncbi:MAG TPA: hypothetical protein VN861_03535 [Candidatus Acidoferrales bacterium]|nr:hypothetical protein [Candidatus Acidoferrales bacterium]